MSWTNANIAKITVKDANVPTNTFSFDGMATNLTSAQADYIQPFGAYAAIQQILDIGGLSATDAGIVRTIKQEDDGE